MENLIYSQFPFWHQEKTEFDRLYKYLLTSNTYHFQLNKAPAKNMWYEYDLPFIGISDEDKNIKTENWLDGVLGIYKSQDQNWEKEGRIVLFRKNILNVAELFTAENGSDIDMNFIHLTKIVLLHELGHWIFHYMPIYNRNDKYNIVSHYNKFFKDIHPDLYEAIAQHFVRKGIEGDEELIKTFDWLCSKQPEIYNNKLPGDLQGLIELHMQKDENNLCTNLKDYNKFLHDNRGRIRSAKFGF